MIGYTRALLNGWIAALGIVLGAAACSPEPRVGGMASSPDGGALGGRAGGTAGRGGGAAGSGGAAGATGGVSGAGGSAGSGGAAGSAGGEAGAIGMAGAGGAAGMPMAGMNTAGAVAGAAGMAVAGMGMAGAAGMPPPPPGPIAKATTGDFFPGTTNQLTKTVAGDPMPGYFYFATPITPGATPTFDVVAAPDKPGLPAAIGFAGHGSVTLGADGALCILGFNFRADNAMVWRWTDVSAYAGFTFWAKATNITEINVTSVDGSNVLVSDVNKGSCAAAPCVSIPGKVYPVTNTWAEYKVRWTDLVQGPMSVMGPVDTKQLARIDILFGAPNAMTTEIWITGVKLATTAELQ